MLVGNDPTDPLTDARLLAGARVAEQGPFDGVERAALATAIITEQLGRRLVEFELLGLPKASETFDDQTLEGKHDDCSHS